MHQFGSIRHDWSRRPDRDPATDERMVDGDEEDRRDYAIALNRFMEGQPPRERREDGARRPCDTSAAWAEVATRLHALTRNNGLDASTLGIRIPVRGAAVRAHAGLRDSSWWPDELIEAFPVARPIDVLRFAGGTGPHEWFDGHMAPTVTEGMFQTAWLVAGAGGESEITLAVLAYALALERDVALGLRVFERGPESGISDLGSLAERYLADRHLLLDRGRFRKDWLPSDLNMNRLMAHIRSDDDHGPAAADEETTLTWMATELAHRLEGQRAVRFMHPEGQQEDGGGEAEI